MAFYSIGAACLPKFGIDDYIGAAETLFYDWLITDIEAFELTFLKFSSHDFFRKGYEVCDDDLRVLDLYSGLRFQHDFPTNPEGKVDSSKIEESLDLVRAKYIRRKERLFEFIKADPKPVFIRYEFPLGSSSEEFENKHADRILETIDHLNLADYRLVIMSDDIISNRVLGRTVFFRMSGMDPEIPWKGCKEDWLQLIALVGAF